MFYYTYVFNNIRLGLIVEINCHIEPYTLSIVPYI